MKKEKTDPVPLEVIQNIEFGILKYIRDVCDANGLRYYLAYGTLIGAVRHQGFVPWDDDVDIHMPRADYMKFVEIVKNNPHPYYKLLSKETTNKYNYLWASKVIDNRTKILEYSIFRKKVSLGLFVDIFILDGAGNSIKEAKETYRNAYSIFCQYKKATLKLFFDEGDKIIAFARWLYHAPERLLGSQYWMNRHEKYCLKKSFDEFTYVGALGTGTSEASRNLWKREWFGDGIDMLFCGEMFCSPCNYDAVLRPEYGDYMVLPPPDKRFSHSFIHIEISSSVYGSQTER